MNKNIAAETLEMQITEDEPGFSSKTKLEGTSSEDVLTPSKAKILSLEGEKLESAISTFKDSIKEEILLPQEIKQINRQISRRITHEKKLELIRDYNFLADKQFNEGLSKGEERQLIYIRWQLDRIDDAEIGEDIDRLEKFTEGVEIFADEISRLIQKFDPTKKRPQPFKK